MVGDERVCRVGEQIGDGSEDETRSGAWSSAGLKDGGVWWGRVPNPVTLVSNATGTGGGVATYFFRLFAIISWLLVRYFFTL